MFVSAAIRYEKNVKAPDENSSSNLVPFVKKCFVGMIDANILIALLIFQCRYADFHAEQTVDSTPEYSNSGLNHKLV